MARVRDRSPDADEDAAEAALDHYRFVVGLPGSPAHYFQRCDMCVEDRARFGVWPQVRPQPWEVPPKPRK